MKVIVVNNLRKVYKRPLRTRTGWLHDLFGRSYQSVTGLDSVSFAVEPGEFVGYVGLNGAGKTTTMKILAGILHPTSGEARVLGYTSWHRERDFLRRIGFVMGQKSQLWWDLPAADVYDFLKTVYEIDEASYRRTLGEMVELLGAGELLHVPVRNLSLGERAKVELIAALLHDPEVVFLDEPTLGLDVLAQRALRGFLAEYNRRYGKTMLLTTHTLSEVETLCSRVIVIHRGKIIWDGSIASLLDEYGRERVLHVTLEQNGALQQRRIEVESSQTSRVLQELAAGGRIVEFREEKLSLEDVIARMLGEDR
ncbi:ABC transporter ATP-binding protein [Oceanithermus sp.]